MFNSASILKYAESGYLLFIVKLGGFRINHQLYETTSKQNTYITTNKMKKITLIALIFSAVGVSAQQKHRLPRLEAREHPAGQGRKHQADRLRHMQSLK